MEKKSISLPKLLNQSIFPKILCGERKNKKVERDLLSINDNFLLFEYSINKTRKLKYNTSSDKPEYNHPRKFSIILPKNSNIKINQIHNNIIKTKSNLPPLYHFKRERINKIFKLDTKNIKLNSSENSLDTSFNSKKNTDFFSINSKKTNLKKLITKKEKSNFSASSTENLNTISTLNTMKKINQLIIAKNNIDSKQEKLNSMNRTRTFTNIFDSKEKAINSNNLNNITTKNNNEIKTITNLDEYSNSSWVKYFIENSQKNQIPNFIKYEYNLAKKYNSKISKKLNLVKLNDETNNKNTEIRYLFWKYELPIIRKYYYDINAFKRKEIERREENKTLYEKLDEIVEKLKKNKKNKIRPDEDEEKNEQVDFFSMGNKDKYEDEEDITNKILKKKEIISNSLKNIYKRTKNQKKKHKIICSILYKNYRSAQKIKKSKSMITYNK